MILCLCCVINETNKCPAECVPIIIYIWMCTLCTVVGIRFIASTIIKTYTTGTQYTHTHIVRYATHLWCDPCVTANIHCRLTIDTKLCWTYNKMELQHILFSLFHFLFPNNWESHATLIIRVFVFWIFFLSFVRFLTRASVWITEPNNSRAYRIISKFHCYFCCVLTLADKSIMNFYFLST